MLEERTDELSHPALISPLVSAVASLFPFLSLYFTRIYTILRDVESVVRSSDLLLCILGLVEHCVHS